MASRSDAYDVVVAGAGLAGLAAALGFARAGRRVASVGRLERGGPGRTVALLGQSLDFLRELGVLSQIEAVAAPMRKLRIVDDAGSVFRARPVEFRAAELGRELFGWNIENAGFADILSAALADAPRLQADIVGYAFGEAEARVTLDDGRVLTTKLVVGADGRGSPARKAAGIDMSARRLPQTALTLIVRHSRPHDDASTEFHTREGPFTLVPLPPSPSAEHRSSLVWLMRDESAARRAALDDLGLAAEIRARAHDMLGEMRIEGGRGVFPMTVQRVARLTARRLALIGDAAHVFPPIGAQGLNLGLRDAAAIVAAAGRGDPGAAAGRGDPGDARTLAGYASSRRGDVALRTLAVSTLNAALLAPPADAVRALGLSALAAFSPLRKIAMREGLSPFLA